MWGGAGPRTQILYYSIHAFIHSVCLSVLGWNAVDRFCCIPRALHISLAKADMNRGSQSKMILLGRPKHGTRCFRYLLATPVPSIVLLHGINFATLEHP